MRGQKLAFHPFMLLEMKGVGVEILMQGMTFFSVQCGVGHVAVSPMGHCICGQPLDSSPEVSYCTGVLVFLQYSCVHMPSFSQTQ